ncbi:7TM diverse intracellular signaling domain-containing protein [Pseudobacteriovorax antillogorgiicola]|uniref:Hpt domain-containing protein n=1 Tax=Pseudobacteriovorax antillogorgiicola TaxID=1513793 RepID=A0A1Y6BM81_9BACT|nr:7TM diverse intracellular signaling domain-containing protein [Pseudobacteriovorax antillogorgiicola]TCS54594.1 histidine kinase/DNA gyrase B/HSP90-like ATPase [Pseudobacteriovorax antillogorgiicola]SMF17702.1 Hpt domain-containing protein [Pseudobacteriovorax antillogorgiicola]
MKQQPSLFLSAKYALIVLQASTDALITVNQFVGHTSFMKVWTVIGLLLIAFPSEAKIFSIDDIAQRPFLGPYLKLYEAPDQSITAQQALEAWQAGEFHDSKQMRPNFGNSDAEYWAILEVENSGLSRKLILENNHGMIDYFDVFLVRNGEAQLHFQGGDQQDFSNRYLKVRTNNTQIEIPEGRQLILMRAQSLTTNILSIRLWDESDYQLYLYWEYIVFGLLIGIHLVMIFYNGFLAITMKDSLYLMYIVFVGSNLVFQVCNYNLGQFFAYHFFSFETFSNHIQLVSVDLIILSAIFFTWNYLDMDKSKYWKAKYILGFNVIFSTFNLLVNHFISVQLTSFCTLIGASIVIATMINLGILRFREGYRPAYYYLLGWGAYIIGSGEAVMINIGLRDLNSFNYWSQFAGGAIEVSLFSIALGSRFNFIKRENNRKIQKLNNDLQEINKDLEAKVEMRTREIRDILKHINQGIFTVTQDNCVDREYSKYLEYIFDETDLGGQNLVELLKGRSDLSSDQIGQLETALDVILGEDDLAFEMNSHLFPEKLIYRKSEDKEPRELEIDWNHLVDGDKTTKILVAVRDMTEKNKMQSEINRKSKEIKLISQLIEVKPERFGQFQKVSLEMLADVDVMLKKGDINDEMVRFMMVTYHTLKGMSRTLNLTELSAIIHSVESEVTGRKETLSEMTFSWLNELHGSIKDALNHYIDINNNQLGRVVDHRFILVSRVLVQRVLNSVEQISDRPKDLNKDLMLLKKYYYRTPEDIAFDQLDSIKNMCDQLSKPIPKFKFNNNSFGLEPKAAEIFEKVLTHLIRNSLSHGLESNQERIAKGKTERGTITISQKVDNDRIALTYQDDGKGVLLNDIADRAKQLGIVLNEGEPVLSVLFYPGFSTKTKVDNISGRGVGMDAVRSLLESVEGTIKIEDFENVEEPERRCLRFEISVPKKYFSKMDPAGLHHADAA